MQHIRKIKAIIILFIMSFLMTDIAYAQIGNLFESVKSIKESIKSKKEKKKEKKADEKDSNAVTLIVSADAKTKDEATKIALRSAIEQAYGTFVSANTTILNDELAKDEIVTISSGNIKEYKEIASEQMPNGNMYVTLQATVSISKLVSYAQSKGAETEFAGSTFGMNMKMKELNKKNEEIALKNLVEQVVALYPSAFSYKLLVDEPKQVKSGNYIWNISKNLSDIGLQGTYKDYYASKLIIGIEPNQQMENINTLILSTLNSLALSKDERNEYENLNIEAFPISIFLEQQNSEPGITQTQINKIHSICDEGKYHGYNNYPEFTFRSNFIDDCMLKINLEIAKILHSFQIVDNLGNVSKITSWKLSDAHVQKSGLIAIFPKDGTNLLSTFCLNFSLLSLDLCKYYDEECMEYFGYYLGNGKRGFYAYNNGINLFDQRSKIGFPSENGIDYSINILFEAFILFPKSEISKYSNFRIEPIPTDGIVIEDPNKLLKIFNK